MLQIRKCWLVSKQNKKIAGTLNKEFGLLGTPRQILTTENMQKTNEYFFSGRNIVVLRKKQ